MHNSSATSIRRHAWRVGSSGCATRAQRPSGRSIPTNHRSREVPCRKCGHSDDPGAQGAHGRRPLRKRVGCVGLDESAGGLHVGNTPADQCSKEFWIVCSNVTGEALHVGRLRGGARDRHAPNNSHHSIDGSPHPRPSTRFPFPSLAVLRVLRVLCASRAARYLPACSLRPTGCRPMGSRNTQCRSSTAGRCARLAHSGPLSVNKTVQHAIGAFGGRMTATTAPALRQSTALPVPRRTARRGRSATPSRSPPVATPAYP